MADLVWTVHDLFGQRLGVLRPSAGSTVEVGLFGQRRAHLELSTEEAQAENLVTPVATVLRAWLDDQPIFAGPVLTPSVNFAEGTVTVDAVGPRYRLERFQLGLRADTAGIAGHAPGRLYRLEQVAQDEMLARLVEHAQPTGAELASGVPGHGIVRGRLASTKVRDREWDDGKGVAEAMDDLAQVIDGPEWDLVTIADPAHPERLARLDVADELGRDLLAPGDLILECGVGADNARITWTPGADDDGPVINRKRGIGDATNTLDPDVEPVNPEHTANQPQSQRVHGIYGRTEGLNGVTEQQTVVEQTVAEVASHAFPVDHFEVEPNLGRLRFAPDGDLWIGDRFTARARSGVVSFQAAGRVTGATVEVADEAGNLRTTISAAPLPSYVVAF